MHETENWRRLGANTRELEQLQKLRKQGGISQADYEQERLRVLGERRDVMAQLAVAEIRSATSTI